MHAFPKPPFVDQPQEPPGTIAAMKPMPDHGEQRYKGSGKLLGKRALITGGDSGIGRAIAIAFVREGADVAIAYFEDGVDAQDTVRLLKEGDAKVASFEGDLNDRRTAADLVDHVVSELGGVDIIVNNAARQATFENLEDIDDEEWERTFSINLHAMFRIVRAALPHLGEGSAIINTTSINADKPNPSMLAYATSKGAIQNFTSGLAQLLAERNIRVNCVAPGPVWTPLIPSTMPADEVRNFGEQTPFKRPAQPVELASVYVMLASDEASYVSGATIAVTGGAPML
jgi:NAD(P)-dependent dehydrogenase (short-subunit alcohol dehydrogenase family)